MASPVSGLADDLCAMADPFLILEPGEHFYTLSACFSARNPRGEKSVSCGIFDAKRLRLRVRAGRAIMARSEIERLYECHSDAK